MRTPSPRLLVVLLLSGAALAARAQTVGIEARENGRRDPNSIAFGAASAKASPLVVRARQRLRARDLSGAERLASEAVLAMQEVDAREPYAHDVLAEVALLRGQPGLALEELGGASPLLPRQMRTKRDGIVVSDRGALTRAIALARLGQLPAARAILDDLSPELRRYGRGWRLPMDGDGSPKALEATADILRSRPGSASDNPEPIEDLREAARLAPNCAAIHYLLSQRLGDKGSLDEALTEANRAATLANEPEAKLFEPYAKALRKAVARRDAKPGG